jgi:uncharacterized protein
VLKRDGYVDGVPCWVDTNQPDPEAAVAFYRDLFGWEFEDAMPAGSAARYYIARLHGGDVAAVGSQPGDGSAAAAAWNTYIWVDSVDDTVSKVLAGGGLVMGKPVDVADAGRLAVCADPEGAGFCLWQAGRHRGAQVVNLPGSLNFNGLNTRDPERAKAFYGSVFGWGTLDLGSTGRAWRRPGYGEFLERSDPGLRRRMADSGAPDGFEDVVATLNAITGDQEGIPAHWSVTFSVDDADATATRAEQLGGRVLVAPFDAPWVRMTVIADPQGAAFVGSRFTPENARLAA